MENGDLYIVCVCWYLIYLCLIIGFSYSVCFIKVEGGIVEVGIILICGYYFNLMILKLVLWKKNMYFKI